MMLNLELFVELGDHCVIEIYTIVCNNSLWNAIPTNQVMPDKPRNNVLGHGSKRGRLNPLHEVINGH